MKAIPSATPTLAKRARRVDADDSGTVVRLTQLGVVQVIRLPKELRFDCESVRLIRDGDRLIIEPVGKSAAVPPSLPGREAPAASGPRPRRKAPDGDLHAPSPVGPKFGR
ncbi:antitoxin [Nevskia ramosa]|uniref:antitoxin n=1 Tax=Nevskia ramosa TaxID=64002 RepID=UPI0003B5A3CD|nr:virulence factor [Nevskia ramosa]